MKRTTALNRSLLATLLLSASMSVFAGGGGGGTRGSQPGGQPVFHAEGSAAEVLAEVDVTDAIGKSAPVAVANGWSTTPADATTHGKTREQVRAELIQAEKAGLVPAGNTDYPPGPDTIERNRMRFAQADNYWHGTQRLNASMP